MINEWDVVKVIIELVGLAVIIAKAVNAINKNMQESRLAMTELKMTNNELKTSNNELKATVEKLTDEMQTSERAAARNFERVFTEINEIKTRVLRLEIGRDQPPDETR